MGYYSELDLYDLGITWQDGLDQLGDAGVDDLTKHGLVDETEPIRLLAEALGLVDPDDLIKRSSVKLIAPGDLEGYAEDFANDTLGLDFDSWPLCCIDWSEAGDQLAANSTTVEYDGEDYMVID